MSFLLDTNVLSETRKRIPNPQLMAWIASTRVNELYTSALVIGEIRRGIEALRRRDQSQAAGYEQWLGQIIHTYDGRVVPVTSEIAEIWGTLNVPDPVPIVDGLLAATALANGWTLVTRNIKDVDRTGARLLNPFEFQG
jgi:predicted nucleic acid-binding protein